MPEGHTLHRLARDLNQCFAGTRPVVSSPQGRFAESAALLHRRQLEAFSAHGKHLFGDFGDGLWLHVHLGLIGTFRIGPEVPPVGEVRLRLAGDRAGDVTGEPAGERAGDGVVADLRGPQLCQLETAAEVTAQQDRLGPDPLRADADPERAWARLSRSARPVAALLMDQAVLSGVGNVYRAEVLFRQRLSPHTPGRALARRSWLRIWEDLVTLMPQGVRDARIDTVRPEHAPEAMGRPPRVDDHGGEVYVYRRDGRPCLVCRTPVSTERLAGRNLFWCRRCQRRR